MKRIENLEKARFDGVGKYGIPPLRPQKVLLPADWISFNYAKSCACPKDKGLHFFVDDYQFVRLWNAPERYLNLLRSFRCVCAPDFSLYTDMPQALQVYNHYRKHWLAAYWQQNGIAVIPTISWSVPEIYDWCFDGEPAGGTVAVSSVGCMANQEAKRYFLQGYEEMLRRLRPSEVIFYGQVPPECGGKLRMIPPYYRQIEHARREKHGRQRGIERDQQTGQNLRNRV